MLSDQEKINVSDLLSTMSTESVLDIAKVTTSGNIIATTREEAIQLILMYTEDVRLLLSRKKLTKQVIFQYLHTRRVPFASSAEKAALIEVLVKYWAKVQTVSTTESNAQALDEFAVKFVEWFYSKLNNKLTASGEGLIREDFWDDAKSMIQLQGNSESALSAESGEDSVSLFNYLQAEHRLFFHVYPQGVQRRSDPHGLEVVTAGGTLLIGEACVGVFDQNFALIRDPNRNDNWRIKKTEAILRSQSGPASLCPS